MSVLDTPLRKVSEAVIDRFGLDVTAINVTYGSYNVTNGAAAETTAATSLKGVLSEYRAHELNDRIKAGDRKLLLPAVGLTFSPDTADRIVIASVTYRIVNVVGHYSGEQVALWELALRGNA